MSTIVVAALSRNSTVLLTNIWEVGELTNPIIDEKVIFWNMRIDDRITLFAAAAAAAHPSGPSPSFEYSK